MADKKEEAPSTAVAVYQPKTAAMIVEDLDGAMKIIAEALGGTELSLNDLDVVKTPTGGITSWEMPDGEMAKELRGVPILKQTPRTYWRKSMNAGDGGPPDCSSPDGDVGFGKRFDEDALGEHACDSCPFNEFGTAVRDDGSPGAGKACAEKTRIFLAVANDLRPLRVELGPTSGTAIKGYWLRQATSIPPKPVYASEAVFTLEKKSNGKNDYAVAKVAAGELLSPDERTKVGEYRAKVVPLLEAMARRRAFDEGAPANDGRIIDEEES